MSRILVRAHQPAGATASAEQTYAGDLIGNNVGNLLFSYAVERQLSVNHLLTRRLGGTVPNPDWVNDNFEHVVIPLANAFRLSFLEPLQRLTAFIRSLRIPVTVVGVGAQAHLDGRRYASGSESVDEAVRDFVRAVLAHGPSIGVRGPFSRDYLRSLGFADGEVDVIGCPSMFLTGPELPSRPGAMLDVSSRISINISPYVTAMGPVVQHNLERYPNLRYAAQDIDTLGLLLDRGYCGKGAGNPLLPTSAEHPLLAPGRTFMALNAPTWLAELRQYDFSFGTRIHGNIAAVLAGTPALVLAHDSRTRELAEYHEIPHRHVSELTEPSDGDARALFERADWSAMHRGHAERFEIYCAFLKRHELRHIFEPGASARRFDRRTRPAAYPPVVRSAQPPLAMSGSPPRRTRLPHAVTSLRRRTAS